jgi:hypothetical protein
MGALATVAAAFGCVADRPSRNGVFNENQYLKKSFMIAPGDGNSVDQGWFLKATVLSVSTPNPFGALGIAPGTENGAFVRFRVTQDKLQMINVKEISATWTCADASTPNGQLKCADGSNAKIADDTRTEEVLNAWPITNVDLNTASTSTARRRTSTKRIRSSTGKFASG